MATAAAATAAAMLRRHSEFSSSLTRSRFGVSVQCSDSSRGFAPKSKNPDSKKIKSKQSSNSPNQASGLNSPKTNCSSSDDLDFEQRLQAIKKSALEQKKEEKKVIGAIDYDAPVENNSTTIGLGTKIGVGVAVVTFGLVFALGDFLPSGSVSPTEEAATVNKISEEERSFLEKRLKEFEKTLATSPEDSTALEGAAVTLAEMREYKRSATLLEKLTEKKPKEPDAFRLLGEVKYELKDYEGSVLAYWNAERASRSVDFEILRGLTNSLLSAKKSDEAVKTLLAARERLNKEAIGDGVTAEMRSDVDPIQVELLLGKAYADWGHISDAVAVYDQIISSHPDDFRGYLAKGIIMKENGSIGDAERMFIQARFFAPDKAKALVDKYSR
ncbi:hypothetical protein AAHA92_19670 [Salvia divinorum]|uniref:Uncharacterized protein n=1 Tax=Salvia divinorum TaxID=28513 RepID=A0ABD1H6L3_SALDI